MPRSGKRSGPRRLWNDWFVDDNWVESRDGFRAFRRQMRAEHLKEKAAK